MSKNPTVSVLMPVYNAEKYVAEAIESILTQTFVDFEFIITDDCSTDSSLKILEAYAAKDKRIHLTSRPNRGLTRR
jgi:glycosyltransferase involved in cell wall biosynthesis